MPTRSTSGRGPVSGVNRQILGGRFRFESGSEALLGLVDAAYAGLPAHRLPVAGTDFRIELRLVPRQAPPHSPSRRRCRCSPAQA